MHRLTPNLYNRDVIQLNLDFMWDSYRSIKKHCLSSEKHTAKKKKKKNSVTCRDYFRSFRARQLLWMKLSFYYLILILFTIAGIHGHAANVYCDRPVVLSDTSEHCVIIICLLKILHLFAYLWKGKKKLYNANAITESRLSDILTLNINIL